MEFVTLANGVKMPKLGYGVFQVTTDETERCVLDAIDAGYRLIDTAQAYGNKEGVGNAVVECGLPREEMFITTKIWFSNNGYEKTKASIEESLRKLQCGYIDLMLIQQPFGDLYGTWHAMEEAYGESRDHVYHQQKKAHEYMVKYGIQHESWGPFAEGKKGLFSDPVLAEVAVKHGKTIAQAALWYLLLSDVVMILKSVRKERMEENINVFNFTLDAADMAAIATLDTGKTLFFDHADLNMVAWFTSMNQVRWVSAPSAFASAISWAAFSGS